MTFGNTPKINFLGIILLGVFSFNFAFSDTQDEIRKSRIDYLINSMDLGNESSAAELKRIAPDIYSLEQNRLTEDGNKILHLTAPTSIEQWPTYSGPNQKMRVKNQMKELKKMYPEKYRNFVIEPINDDSEHP